LQEGGLSAHEQITATDKDFKPAFERLCRLATKNIFKLAHAFGEDVADFYEDADVENMLSNDNIEVLIEDVFLEHVYGAKSRLPNEEWLEKVGSKEGKWIYCAEEFRNKLMETAGVEKKH